MLLRALALAIVAGAVASLGAGCARATMEVPIGAGVRHDDFTFTVLGAQRSGAPSGGLADVAVRLRIANQARRVSYRFSPSIAFVVDGKGRRYEAAAARSSPAERIEPGSSAVETLVFRVPSETTEIALGYWDGVLMGDLFDGLQYARARVRI